MSEDGKVEIVDIKFGNKLYKNVSVDRLNPTDESSHSHPRKKRKKVKLEQLKEIIKEVMAEEKINMFLEKNVPTNDVYPSAYANACAAKQYKAAGGGWKKG